MIYEILHHGQDNAITVQDLADCFHTDKRSIQAQVSSERLSGKIIANCGKGLYIPDTIEEYEDYIRRTVKQARHHLGTLTFARRRLKELKEKRDGQLSL